MVWRDARALTSEIYRVTDSYPFFRDRGLVDQIRRAAVSVMSNIAEGFERGSEADFSRFLFIAKGSCGEIRSQLYIALDQRLIDAPTFESLRNRAGTLSRRLHTLNRAVRLRAQAKRTALQRCRG